MEGSFLEKNLAQIARYNKKLADKIANLTEISSDFEFLESKSGDIILSYNGILLHDDIDPQEEAFNVLKKVPSNSKATVHVLFGLGLGYLLKRFSLDCKGKIIVYEPNLDILRITLEAVDFSQEFSRNDIALTDSKEDIQKYFDSFFFGDSNVNLSFLKSYAKIYPDTIQELAEELGFVKGLYACNYSNLFEMCYGWTLSGICNIPEILEHNEVESLRNRFKDKPAVIISAGPSLTKNIDILKKYKDKAVTFCVGSALKTAVKHSVQPDFLTVVEAQDCSFQAIGVDTSDLNLILHPMTYRFFHNLPVKRHFNYYPNNDFTTLWLSEFLDISAPDYYNKGTVSMCAVFSAMIMGCNPIILIGQDLAYTEGKCYSEGSPFQDLRCVKNEKTGNFEIQCGDLTNFAKIIDPQNKYIPENNEKLLQERIEEITKGLYLVKGQNGETLLTEPGYATFIRYFENVAKEHGDKIKFINSTEGGAYLEGFEHIPLEAALNNYVADNLNIEDNIKEALKLSRKLFDEKAELILSELDKTIELLKESFSYFQQGQINTEQLIKQIKFNRIHSDPFKKHCEEVLANFLLIEQRIINNNKLILGLIYPEYSKLSNYLKTNDNIDMDSIKKLVDLAEDFFIKTYEHLQKDLLSIEKMRNKLHESCNTKSQTSIS